MSDTLQGAVLLAVFMAIVFATSRVLAYFTGMKYAQAMNPLAPLINGTFSTDSLSHGWLEGTYQNRAVHLTAIPGISPYSDGGNAHRYNAFEVSLPDVPGAHDWSLQFGSHSVTQIFTGEESWNFHCSDDALKERLQNSAIIAEIMQANLGSVRGFPTVIYSAQKKNLMHRDNVSPSIAPSPQRLTTQLKLVLWLSQTNEQLNSLPVGIT